MTDSQRNASLNSLLKWGIENSSSANASGSTGADGPGQDAGSGPVTVTSAAGAVGATAPSSDAAAPRTQLDPDVMNAIFGGPSDAELMKESMRAIESDEVSIDDKLVAFDNLEQLVESIDNANNLGPLDLWQPLVRLLASSELRLRFMAAWCIGTAVQNNTNAQETAVTVGAVPPLVRLATNRPPTEQATSSNTAISAKTTVESGKEQQDVQRKSCYAISSLIRNCQAAATAAVEALPKDLAEQYRGLEANDMEAIDGLIEQLRSFGSKAPAS